MACVVDGVSSGWIRAMLRGASLSTPVATPAEWRSLYTCVSRRNYPHPPHLSSHLPHLPSSIAQRVRPETPQHRMHIPYRHRHRRPPSTHCLSSAPTLTHPLHTHTHTHTHTHAATPHPPKSVVVTALTTPTLPAFLTNPRLCVTCVSETHRPPSFPSASMM